MKNYELAIWSIIWLLILQSSQYNIMNAKGKKIVKQKLLQFN